MCGLVGMAGDIQKDDRNMFDAMLIVDVIRGPHSTGVASVTDRGRFSTFKKAVLPHDLMAHKMYDKVVTWDSQVLIGHNRYATVGRIDNRSAHPFEFDGMVGAHNGTLKGWTYDLEDTNDFDVDSECLLHNINKFGWDQTIKKADGAIALSVYHQDQHSICLYRNKERPLYFGFRSDGKVVYWASEAWMIRTMAQRAGVKLDKQILQLKENTLLSFNLPKQKGQPLEEPHIRKLAQPEKKYQAVGYQAPVPPRQPADGGGSKQTGASNSSSNPGNSKHVNPNDDHGGLVKGDPITFVPFEEVESAVSGQMYIEGVMTEAPWCMVRLYVKSDKRRKALLDEGRELNGTVVACAQGVGKDDPYIVVGEHDLTFGDAYTVGKHDDLLVDEVPGPYGRSVNKMEFDELALHGCGLCCCDVDFCDDGITWFNNTPICAECASEAF